MDIVTGQKIQFLCDIFIGMQRDLVYNPLIAPQTQKHIDILNPDITRLQNKTIKNVFCYTHNIDEKIFNKTGLNEMIHPKIIFILKQIPSDFNLIFHNSDGSFSDEHLFFLDIPNVKKIFTQNINTQPTDRVIPIPIGIANSMWKHGNLGIWKKIMDSIDIDNKTDHIFFNFSINTNSEKRLKCYNSILSKNIPNLPNTNYEQYLRNLVTYKFAICPDGNGTDTHRLWECLYLRVIPICTKSYLTEHYSNIFPILLINDWDDINDDILSKFSNTATWSNYEKLSFNNLKNQIIN
jgi:hypothetical protein